MTSGNNGERRLFLAVNRLIFQGFTTYEVGAIRTNSVQFVLKDVGRISFSRDLPVEDVSENGFCKRFAPHILQLRRTFVLHDDQYLEQV